MTAPIRPAEKIKRPVLFLSCLLTITAFGQVVNLPDNPERSGYELPFLFDQDVFITLDMGRSVDMASMEIGEGVSSDNYSGHIV